MKTDETIKFVTVGKLLQELIDELEGYDKNTKVYLAGCGLYLSFEQEGGIFCEPSDDDGIVGGYATVFGHYEVEPQGGRTEALKVSRTTSSRCTRTPRTVSLSTLRTITPTTAPSRMTAGTVSSKRLAI